MNLPDEAVLYREAYRKWGIEAQMDMVIEEAAELTKEICKAHRKGLIHVQCEVTEELVDLEIMLEQLKVILSDHLHSFDGMYMRKREEKLNRLHDRLTQEEAKSNRTEEGGL